MAWIAFRGVQKAFGEKVIYRNLCLEVTRGESLTVIGGSGQGKSVMLKMLIGLLGVDAGEIEFDGQSIAGLRDREMLPVRRRIGMLFQGAALFDSLDVYENIAYGLREHFQMSSGEIADRVAESLGHVGLPGIEQMWPSDLSGGMKKRVGLARAIAVRPEVLLYDEPTTGLDPVNVRRIDHLILRLKEQLNVTSIVVTHDMESAFRVSDRMAMVDQGEVIFTGTPDELRNTDDPRVRAFVVGDVQAFSLGRETMEAQRDEAQRDEAQRDADALPAEGAEVASLAATQKPESTTLPPSAPASEAPDHASRDAGTKDRK